MWLVTEGVKLEAQNFVRWGNQVSVPSKGGGVKVATTWSVHLDAPGQRHGQQPVYRTADPGILKQDKSSRGSVDTTKTRLDPQWVRMSSGERPIGAAKGKQPNTEALCQNPPTLPKTVSFKWGGSRGDPDQKLMGGYVFWTK